MEKIAFKGIKQVLSTTFESVSSEDRKGYLWFVRTVDENSQTISGDIYFGEKHYGHVNESEISTLETKINNIIVSLGNAFDENGEWVGFLPTESHNILANKENITDALVALESSINTVAESNNTLTRDLYDNIVPMIESEIQLRDQQKEATDKALEGKVNWSINEDGSYGHKIVLPVADGAITGTINNGTPEEPVAGDGAQLIGLSKWNKVEVGSTKVQLNLNSLANEDGQYRVTVNDNESIAYLSDINKIIDGTDLKLVKLSDPEGETFVASYQLQGKDGKVLGDTINIAKDQFLKSASYDPITKTLIFTFILEDGSENESRVPVNDLVDIYLAGAGIELTKTEKGETVININNDSLTKIQYADSEVRRLETDKVSWAYDEKTQSNINILLPSNGSLIQTIDGDNTNLIKGATYDDSTKQIEVGSTKIHLNLNSNDRPTIEVTGETGNSKYGIAYQEDLEALSKRVDEHVTNGLLGVDSGNGIEVSDVSDHRQTISVKLSTDEGNLLEIGSDGGLFMAMYYEGDDVE